MLTVLIDTEAGNLHSAEKAFQRMARESGAGEILVSHRPEDVLRADRLVLPGDGAFPASMAALCTEGGILEALREAVESRGRPFLGICVGMQLMADRGLEYEPTEGLGWIAGEVRHIAPADPSLKVPHMGWNDLSILQPHPVLEGVETGQHAYFVHAWHLVTEDTAHLLATADYGGPITAIVGRDNVVGTQFHPEKSQTAGLRIIANFLAWTP